jgi:hypothetical protein
MHMPKAILNQQTVTSFVDKGSTVDNVGTLVSTRKILFATNGFSSQHKKRCEASERRFLLRNQYLIYV